MANYQWRASTRYQSDTSLSYGVDPTTWDSWQTAAPGHQAPGTITYWYRDANVSGPGGFTDANSSRVAISVTETWDAAIDSSNNLTITLTTTLNSVVRDDLRGSNQNTPGRNINIYREQGGSAVLALTDNQLASAHTIWSGPATLSVYTFTLAPGQDLERSSLFVHNQTSGAVSYDDIWAGIQFKNPLPADYRPGALVDNNVWLSHNRNGGEAHVFNGSNWTEMRTLGAPSAKGNPPSLFHNDKWYNMAKIGKE